METKRGINFKSVQTWAAIILVLFLTRVLFVQYLDCFDVNIQADHETYQKNSEWLVEDMVVADYLGLELSPYGLGRVYYATLWETAEQDNVIVFAKNSASRNILLVGNVLVLDETMRYTIEAVEEREETIAITIDGTIENLAVGEDARIQIEQDGQVMPMINLEVYSSQVGVQGMIGVAVFRLLGGEVSTTINLLYDMACAAMAVVAMAICLLIAARFSVLLGGCYYIVFLASPFIVCFARNLYWMEFTWFVPMLIGLLYCVFPKQYKWWALCAFLALLFKSLCGFEYVSTILVGMMMFPAVVWLTESKTWKTFWHLVWMGAAGVLGFVGGFVGLAFMRGNGNFIGGVKSIYYTDILRRTYGDAALFSGSISDSLNATVWQVVKGYLQLSMQVLSGVDRAYFSYLALIPIAVGLFYLAKGKAINWQMVLLYVISACATLSWLVLAKAHSYLHGEINMVLWYFGFIQFCIYVLCREITTQMGLRHWDNTFNLCAFLRKNTVEETD